MICTLIVDDCNSIEERSKVLLEPKVNMKVKRGRFYFGISLIGNTVLWTAALAYLNFAKPVYTSNWTINLPATRSSTNVNLPGIGSAISQMDSPYSTHTSDPREIYKFLATTKEVREAAASQRNIALEELGKLQVEILDNTTLMRFNIEGNTPLEAYENALAIHNSLEERLNQLREQEIAQQELNLQRTLDLSRRQLREAQKRLSEYKVRVPVSSREQMQILSTNIEDLRRQRAETLAQRQQRDGSLRELSANLGLSIQEASDALALQSDLLFQQYLADYSRINSELVNLQSMFLPDNPVIIDKQAEKDEALSALVQRSQSLLRKPVSSAFLEQFSFSSNSPDSNSSILLQELILLQTQREGLQNQAVELEQQVKNLENRLSVLSPRESALAELQRDVQIAEAIFSSTMTKLDLSQSSTFNNHPSFQIIEQPNIPEETTSPNRILLLLGTSISSLFLTTGLLLLWWRDRSFKSKGGMIAYLNQEEKVKEILNNKN